MCWGFSWIVKKKMLRRRHLVDKVDHVDGPAWRHLVDKVDHVDGPAWRHLVDKVDHVDGPAFVVARVHEDVCWGREDQFINWRRVGAGKSP